MKQTIKETLAKLTKRAPDELVQAKNELADITAKKDHCEARIADAKHDFYLGGETWRLDQLQEETARLEAERAELVGQETRARTKVGVLQAEADKRQRLAAEEGEIERLRAIPAARGRYLDAVDKVEALAPQLGEALREQVTAGRHLSEAIGLDPMNGPFSLEKILWRQKPLLAHFGFEPPDGNGGVEPAIKRFLTGEPIPGSQKTIAAGLVAAEKPVVAEFVTIYADRREAEEACLEIDPTGEQMHVSPEPRGGLWTIRQGRYRYPLTKPDDARKPQESQP